MPSVTFTTSGVLQKSALREANDRLVLDTIRRNPGISRNKLAKITAFSPTSMSFVVNRLLRSGLIREEKLKSSSSSGRPPTGLWLRSDALTAIGVEIARPTSHIILVNLEGQTITERQVGWKTNPKKFLEKLAEEIRAIGALPEAKQVLSVGVSISGTIERKTGRVIGAESIGWFDVEAGKILGGLLDWPVLFENNANLSAMAEQWNAPGLGSELRYCVYIQMKGGLGSAVIVDGRVLHGYAASGTEFGHITLYPDGLFCNCGNKGCWEQYASDLALVRNYRERAALGNVDEIDEEESWNIVALAREGDAHALGALEDTAKNLGLGLASMTAALNPQTIIVGEPIASAWDLAGDIIQNVVAERVPAYFRNGLKVLPSRVKTRASLQGAAILALKSYFNHFDQVRTDTSPSRVVMEPHASR